VKGRGAEEGSPERLGERYERELGAKDPRRRKSLGIHYTPAFVVDYLVE